MDNNSFQQRTFLPYFLPTDSVARLTSPVAERCNVSHHDGSSPSDFRAMLLMENGLQPLTLRRQGQDFPSVATVWETVHSGILNPNGAMPVVDEGGTVIAYLTAIRAAGVTHFELLGIDGARQLEWLEEIPLEPSLPFELALAFISFSAGSAIAKTSGGGLRMLLRNRLRSTTFADIGEVFRFGEQNGFKPHFLGSVRSTRDGTVFQIDFQVTTTIHRVRDVEVTAARETAFRFAARTARERGQPTFIMKIKQSNPASTEAADKLFRQVGVPGSKREILSGVTYNDFEYTLDTTRALQKVGE